MRRKPSLARYKGRGPWGAGAPVHETVSVLAVKKAVEKLKADGVALTDLVDTFDTSRAPRLDDPEGHKFDPKHADAYHQQFMPGSVWADDPKCLWFDDNRDATNYSSGLQWGVEYKLGEMGGLQVRQDRPHGAQPLRRPPVHAPDGQRRRGGARSHQAEHAPLGAILGRCRRRQGQVGHACQGRSAITPLFPANADWATMRLLGNAKANDADTSQRAVGVLFHLIQDSPVGHHDRDPETGDIREHHAYASQDTHKHGEHDVWAEGATLGDRIANTRGAAQ